MKVGGPELKLRESDRLGRTLLELRELVWRNTSDDWHLVAEAEVLFLWGLTLLVNAVGSMLYMRAPGTIIYSLCAMVLAFFRWKDSGSRMLKDAVQLRSMMLFAGPRTTVDLLKAGADESAVEWLDRFDSVYLTRFNRETPLDWQDLLTAELRCLAVSLILFTAAHGFGALLGWDGLPVIAVVVLVALLNMIPRYWIRKARREFDGFMPRNFHIEPLPIARY